MDMENIFRLQFPETDNILKYSPPIVNSVSRMGGASNVMPGIIEDLDISCLMQSTNPLRQNLGGIEELARSIRQNGLLNPLTVRVMDSQSFEIVAGSRRFHACKILGWRKLPCHIVSLDDRESYEVSLIENLQRHSMSVLEEARAFKKYVEELGWGGTSELALRLGKSTSYVTKRIHLLDLPPSVIESIMDSTLKPSVAEEICSIKDKETQTVVAEIITRQSLSFRRSRSLVKAYESEDKHVKSVHEIKTEKIIKSLDKGITTLRIAMSRISELVKDNEGDDFVVSKLMYHKNLLHEQIDDLIREKRKAVKNR